jgi:tRNA(Ile)-lysidine synthase
VSTAPPDPERLFHPIAARAHVALAVSGGSDSVALMRLAAEWRSQRQGAPRLTVLSVDHGLRPEAAREAQQVAQWSAQCGLAHHILVWHGAKPRTGIQARARAARYHLMTDWCHGNDATALLTAHTLDDQAETVLMRLGRSARLDSLAGIPRFGQWNGIELFRPFIGLRRQPLRDHLTALGQDWIDDPSNADERFERVRVRKALPVLAGLGVTVEALGELAGLAAEAVECLWRAAGDWTGRHVRVHDAGYGLLPLALFMDQTQALRLRILGLAICRFGAGRMPEPAELERLGAWLAAGKGRRTLGGAIIACRKEAVLIGREAGRIDPRPVPVAGDGRVLWDGRFEIRALEGSSVIPAACAGRLARRRDLPGFVQAALPAIMRAGGAICVPQLEAGCDAEAVFLPRPPPPTVRLR